MARAPDPAKAKTARRVIEVLEYFDDTNRQATVMDIVRRYNRPQSSTSELLASLVDMGLLYKDASSRSYTLTPRAAILGSLAQPEPVRDGRLSTLVDQLAAQTGLAVALVGMVGLNAQLFRWKSGSRPTVTRDGDTVYGGEQERLCDSAAGWLLLSTLAAQRREGLLRRMNAEADSEHHFDHSVVRDQVEDSGRLGIAVGPMGFGTRAQMCMMLLPATEDERPLAIGFAYEGSEQIDREALTTLLRRSIDRCFNPPQRDGAILQLVSDAA
jgi:DNA-binding IclR family transcriptional regulator